MGVNLPCGEWERVGGWTLVGLGAEGRSVLGYSWTLEHLVEARYPPLSEGKNWRLESMVRWPFFREDHPCKWRWTSLVIEGCCGPAQGQKLWGDREMGLSG